VIGAAAKMIAAKIGNATDVYVDIISSKNLKETSSSEFD